MMLKKVISIKNIGRFKDSVHSGDTSFAKHTFVFGTNGHGKSTLCSILRSLKNNNPDLILGRKTLGSNEASTVSLLTANGSINFNGSGWNSTYEHIAIFDNDFIAENVHSGDVVDTGHKRNLYRVIIGQAGVSLAQQEAQFANDARTATSTVSSCKRALETHIPEGYTLKTFLTLTDKQDIDDLIQKQQKRLETIQVAATIASKPILPLQEIPILSGDLEVTLNKTMENLEQDAEDLVTAHLATHNMDLSKDSRWIEYGLQHSEEYCPFCGTSIEGVQLIKMYRAVLGESYKALHEELTSLRSRINNEFGDIALAQIEAFESQLANGVEYWQQYCDLALEQLTYPSNVKEALIGLKTSMNSLLEVKSKSLFKVVKTDDDFQMAKDQYYILRSSFDSLNAQIEIANSLISSKKEEAANANLQLATNELNTLKSVQLRFRPDIAALCADYNSAVINKDSCELQKNLVRQRLDTHTASVVKPYESRINELLEGFNAGFNISETKHSYAGGIATSTYQLVINSVPVDLGSSATPHNIRSFRNTLSAGDRSSLAMAFFIAHLENDPDLAEKIVVFDDPFNSQDAFRRRQTIIEIIKIGRACKQIVVLSHDPTFLKQIWDRCLPAERAALHLIDHGDVGSRIKPHDLVAECQGRTKRDVDDIQTFVSSGIGNPVDIIRKMRVVLETHLHINYPNDFGDRDWLGDMLGKIRLAGNTHPAGPVYDKISEINDYTSEYHHGENMNVVVPDQIDPAELKGYAKRTLKILNV